MTINLTHYLITETEDFVYINIVSEKLFRNHKKFLKKMKDEILIYKDIIPDDNIINLKNMIIPRENDDIQIVKYNDDYAIIDVNNSDIKYEFIDTVVGDCFYAN